MNRVPINGNAKSCPSEVGEKNVMRQSIRTILASAVLAVATLPFAGCSAMKNGDMATVKPVTANQRVGSVYLLRGFIGVFSTGIDSLGKQLADKGLNAQVFQESQWSSLADQIIAKYRASPDHEPIVLIGHSYGADSVIRISRKLNDAGVKVQLAVTLDPVTPPRVPDNIELVYNLYQSNGALDNLPWLRGIPLKPEDNTTVALRNMDIRKDRTDLLESGLDHFNIEKKPKIQQDVIAQVMKVCEPRPMWTTRIAARNVAMMQRQTTPLVAVVPLSNPVTPATPATPVTAAVTPASTAITSAPAGTAPVVAATPVADQPKPAAAPTVVTSVADPSLEFVPTTLLMSKSSGDDSDVVPGLVIQTQRVVLGSNK
jgi:pimeloyl-ACP methyl ester carboxylesterase